METESGTEPFLKYQEIFESGYSSEKASAVTSPVSAEESQISIDVDSPLNSIKNHSQALVLASHFEPRKIGGSLETPSFTGNAEEELNLKNLKNTEEREEANLISISTNSEKSPMSPFEKEVSEEKTVDEENKKENEGDEKELVNFFGPEPEPKGEKELTQISNQENKNNDKICEDHSTMNGVAKITSNISRMGINHSHQSPTRYSTNEGEFSIQSCLNQFTAQELMTGNNKVGCEACTEKANKVCLN